MNLTETLERFFEKYKKEISFYELSKKFSLESNKMLLLNEALYELEKKGKIYFNENKKYMHVPQEFYLYYGLLKKSNSNRYYINLGNGSRIVIKNPPKDVKENDSVFVEKNEKSKKHPKYAEGKIVRVVKKEPYENENNFLMKGILKKEGNQFYIKNKEKKIWISIENLNTAFVGDLVNVKVQQKEGEVLEVLKRHHDFHIFEYQFIDDSYYFVPVGSSYGKYIIPKMKCNQGDLILAKFSKDGIEFVRKIEEKTIDKIEAKILDAGFSLTFPEEVIEEEKKISEKIEENTLQNRKDLRKLTTITIDPKTAKDLDDAISLTYEDGIYHLYVHTADPSYYVKVDSQIFKEAFRRCFSVYPPDTVVPMLPEKLCNEVCSLNENGVKLSFTCELSINESGEVIDFDIYKSIIENNKKMDYDTVNDILEGRKIEESYFPYASMLLQMNALSNILQKKKVSRGALIFENNEQQFSYSKNGYIREIKDQNKGPSQLMIENFMILANENISIFAHYLNLPFLYRNHEKPTIVKELNLQYDLMKKGYFFQKLGNIDHPKALQQFLLTMLANKNKEEAKFLSNIMLKAMNRAFYHYENIGHYGLALECYGTFTSPIRKISDLLNHMVITEFLENGIESKKLDVYREIIQNSYEYISEKQKDADFLEQDIEDYLLEQYVYNFIGKTLEAKIYFMNKDGIYIKTDNNISGIIPMSKNFCLKNGVMIDTKYQKVYKSGDTLDVSLKNINKRNFIFEVSLKKEKILKKEC